MVRKPAGAVSPGRDLVQVQLAMVPVLTTGLVALNTPDRVDASLMLVVASVAVVFNGLGLRRSLKEFGKRSDVGIVLLQVACLFWFFGPGFTTALSPNQFRARAVDLLITNDYGVRAYLAVSVFYFGFTVTYQAARGTALATRLATMLRSGPTAHGQRVVPYLVLASVVAMAFYVVASGGLGAMLANFTGSRQVTTAWDSAGNHGTSLSSLHFIFSAVLTVCSSMAGYYTLSGEVTGGRRALLAGLALVTMLAVSVESGTRSVLALCVIPPAIALYRRYRVYGAGGRRQVGTLVVLAVLAMAALAMANFQLHNRNGVETTEVDLSINHNDFLTHTAFAFRATEREGRFTYDSPGLHLVTGPIPRVLWSGKPKSEALIVFTKYMWGVDINKTGGNNLPSIVGQYYMGWGWFGVFEIGFWLGLFVAIGDRAVRRMHPSSPSVVAYGVFLAYLFVSFRAIGFYYFTPVPVAWVFARHLSKLRVQSELPRGRVPAAGAPPRLTI